MKVLVCGCGSIGKRHIRNIVDHFGHDVFVFDPISDMLKAVERELAVRTVENENEALDSKPDVVIVAGPTSTHIEVARKAIAVGAHVFIEKPISHSLEGVEGLLEEAQKKNLFIGVGSNMRFYPGPSLLKKNLNRLGNVYFSRASVGQYLPNMRPGIDYKSVYASQKCLGGGVILDDIHEIDYHLWLFGKVDEVLCQCGEFGQLEIDVEDCAEISIRFSSGVMSQIHMDFLSKCRTRTCEIVGENGSLLWEERGQPVKCSVMYCGGHGSMQEKLLDHVVLDSNECYVAELKEFFDIIEGKAERKVLADAEEGLEALRVADLAKQSAIQKKAIEL